MRPSSLFLLPLILMGPVASAALTIRESFEYTAGGTLVGQNGGVGFSEAYPASASGHTLAGTNTSLTYPASSPLVGQGGRLEISTSTNITTSRGLATGARMNLNTDGLHFYASALITIGEIGQSASIQFTDGTNVRFAFGVDATGKLYAAMNPAMTGQVANSPTTAVPGTTYLVVAYLRTNTGTAVVGNDDIFVKVFSPTDTIVAPTTDAGWDAKISSLSGVNLNQMRILANNASTTTTIQLDEIRVGTTFFDATGVIPEPGSVALSGLALALGLVRRRR